MTKKLAVLACIATLALGASAETGPWKTAPKSHSVGGSFHKAAPLTSPGDLTKKATASAVVKIGPSAPKGKLVGRK